MHALGMPGTFSPPPQVSDPDMHHGSCVTHVPWRMQWPLTSGFLWSRWRGKRSRHSRYMRNPQYCLSGKRPMVTRPFHFTQSEDYDWDLQWLVSLGPPVKSNTWSHTWYRVDGLAQDCSNSSALAMELLQSCAKQWSYCSLAPSHRYKH